MDLNKAAMTATVEKTAKATPQKLTPERQKQINAIYRRELAMMAAPCDELPSQAAFRAFAVFHCFKRDQDLQQRHLKRAWTELSEGERRQRIRQYREQSQARRKAVEIQAALDRVVAPLSQRHLDLISFELVPGYAQPQINDSTCPSTDDVLKELLLDEDLVYDTKGISEPGMTAEADPDPAFIAPEARGDAERVRVTA